MLKDKNLYYVGGVVRDEFLGKESVDTDFCYEGNAIEFSKKFNVIKENPAFGTVRVLFEGKEIDIASTRTETYPKKGHLPVVENIGCSLKEDLKRRDFTINAIAKRTTDSEIIDYYGGQNDIENNTLRVLHDESFIDDPTRIIRGLKFSIRFGFELDSHTKRLQEDYINNINYDMSYFRLKKELIETFDLNQQEVLDKFIEEKMYKLLGANQPEINHKILVEKYLKNVETENIWLIYMSFFNLENLPLTKAEKRILEWADKLEQQKINHNTPNDSIIINEIRRENG